MRKVVRDKGTWLISLYAFVALLLSGCPAPKRDRYYLPNGFKGMAHIRFGVVSAPALPAEDGFRVVRVPSSGEVSTSSPIIPGEGYRDEYICSDDLRKSGFVRRGWTSGEGGGIWIWNFEIDCGS
jgi:hypothetical protein